MTPSILGTSPHPDLRLFFEAHAGVAGALERLGSQQAGLIQHLRGEGTRSYGDLGLGRADCVRALARLVVANAEAETRAGAPCPGLDAVLRVLVLADVFLSEGLLLGNAPAWSAFGQVIEAAFRSVKAHFPARTAKPVIRDIQETVLGTFYLEGKVATYRATAPIGAWARQVIFNLFRQAVLRRGNGPQILSFSQLVEGDHPAEGLLPPSKAPPPLALLERDEWNTLLARVVPAALKTLDPEERRMLELLPTRIMTQVELCRRMGISPFKLNRWYKDVRRRFLREVKHRLRVLAALDGAQIDRVLASLGRRWRETP